MPPLASSLIMDESPISVPMTTFPIRPRQTSNAWPKTKSQIAVITTSIVIGTILMAILLILAYRKRKSMAYALPELQVPTRRRSASPTRPRHNMRTRSASCSHEVHSMRMVEDALGQPSRIRASSAAAALGAESWKRHGRVFALGELSGEWSTSGCREDG